MNNTLEMNLYMGHPGDELLMVYGDFPTKQVRDIKISPKKALTVVQTRLIATKQDWKLRNKLSGCYKHHMDSVFERRCTLPWTEHFTNRPGLGNCTNKEMLNHLISSKAISAWLMYNSTSPCKGTI